VTQTAAAQTQRRPPGVEAVYASPEAVLAQQRSRWLDLFTPEARIEDPVGAACYEDAQRRAAFWDTFIAPQRRIEFRPRREFLGAGLVVRQVVIDTITPASDEPLSVPAIIEYRLRGDRIDALRAFWSPKAATVWFAAQGRSGLGALARHNVRIARRLGLRSLVAFGSALRPSVTPSRATAWIEGLLGAGGEPDWAGEAQLQVHRGSNMATDRASLRRCLDDLGSAPKIDQLVCAGREVAAVVAGMEASAVLLIDASGRSRPDRLRLVSSSTGG
jgi:hypothetical protein